MNIAIGIGLFLATVVTIGLIAYDRHGNVEDAAQAIRETAGRVLAGGFLAIIAGFCFTSVVSSVVLAFVRPELLGGVNAFAVVGFAIIPASVGALANAALIAVFLDHQIP